ncbi:MAG: homoserine kinase [Nitrososphaeraceae archaeon]
MKEVNMCVASAPSSTANLGSGFDVFGLALDLFTDEVKITKYPNSNENGRISIDKIFSAEEFKIPMNIKNNSAGLVIEKIVKDFKINNSLKIEITKGVPPGYGIGSSAASATAAALACNELFDLKMNKEQLIKYAAEGEIASAGTKHYDNVSSSLLGGFTIVRTKPKIEFIKIEPPENLRIVIAIPKINVPKNKTEVARKVIPKTISIEDLTTTISNASSVVAGFASKNVDMIGKGIKDIIVEPLRKQMIPGYDQVKKYALDTGSLAVTISGAGPSIIAFLNTDENTNQVKNAMKRGFRENNVDSDIYLCKPSNGAKIEIKE